MNEMICNPHQRIKWSYATHTLDHPPETRGELFGRLGPPGPPPRPDDVVVAEVLAIERHDRLELASGRRAALFPGDLVGVAYGRRYATRQWQGIIPDDTDPCHLLSVGGVCGEVVDKVEDMEDPTTLRPLGYLLDSSHNRVNLQDYGLQLRVNQGPEPTVILVVGSSMDSGKTTAAYSVIHGLHHSGAHVAAGKLTGTGTGKDIHRMLDAGADHVLDFTDIGHVSTAGCSRDQLWNIFRTMQSHLASSHPDYIVLEIADGIAQCETLVLLDLVRSYQRADYVVYTCCDTLGVRSGVEQLRALDLNVAAISGVVACSPLAAREAQSATDVPVLEAQQLGDPAVAALFPHRRDGVYCQEAVG